MNSLQITQENDASENERAIVLNGLRAYNRQHSSAPNWLPLTLLARDLEGTIRGGLLGETGWNWLYVEILWIDEAYRGQGYGSALLAAAEKEAQNRGCSSVYLDTFDFQALPFYQQQGYSVFGVLEDYPPGSRRSFLQKHLR